MVLSASSVVRSAVTGSPFALVQQAGDVGRDRAAADVAAPRGCRVRACRTAGLPGAAAVGRSPLLVLVAGRSARGQRQPELARLRRPFQLQPSELAKLALVLWGADLLARKERLLDAVEAPAGAAAPGRRGWSSCWSCSAATSAPAGPARGRSWRAAVGRGAPVRLFVGLARCWPRCSSLDPHRRSSRTGSAHDRLPRPVRRPAGRRLPGAARACSRSPPAAGAASGSARAGRSGAACPRRTPTSSSRSSARSWG